MHLPSALLKLHFLLIVTGSLPGWDVWPTVLSQRVYLRLEGPAPAAPDHRGPVPVDRLSSLFSGVCVRGAELSPAAPRPLGHSARGWRCPTGDTALQFALSHLAGTLLFTSLACASLTFFMRRFYVTLLFFLLLLHGCFPGTPPGGNTNFLELNFCSK